SAAKVPPRTTTIATASSRAKPPSTAGRRPGGTLPGCAGSGAAPTSDIEVGHLQRVGLDELATRLDHVAHQGAEDLVGGDRVLDAHAQQAAGVRIDRGVPQLLGVHFTQALEALDLATLLGL